MNVVVQELLEYLRGMWRRRFVGLIVAWIVAVVGVIATFVYPDQYEASARLYVDTQSVLKPLMSGLAVRQNVEEQVAMLSRTLLSRPNMEKVVRMADLDLNLKTKDQREALIDKLMKAIEVKGSPEDNLYSIKYRDQFGDQAKRVVDSLLSIFVESGLGGKRKDTEKATQFLEQQIQEYERKLQEAERRLKDFKLRNLTAFGGGSDSLSAMTMLEEQMGKARMELRAAAQARDAIKKELDGEEPVFLPDPNSSRGGGTSGEGSVPELDSRIDAQKKALDELLRRYTDEHPDVIGTRRILAELEKQKKEQLDARKAAMANRPAPDTRMASNVDRNPVYQQLKLALAEQEAKVASMRASMEEIEVKYNTVKSTARMRPELEEELVQLNRDYQVQKQNYDSLIQRRESALMTGQLEQTSGVADFRIIDPPRVSPKPVAPNRLLLYGIVVLLSLGSGLFASFAYSQIYPTFHTTKSLRKISQRPVLGAISMQETDPVKRKRRLGNVVFGSAVGALFAFFGSALALLLLIAKTA